MPRRLPTLAALLVALLWVPASAFAAMVQVVPSKGGARLIVGGKLVTIFRVPNDGVSPGRRADIAAERLRRMIEDGLGREAIVVRRRGEDWGVYAAVDLIMIATPEEARERGEDPETTARRWAANLKAALPAARSASRSRTGARTASAARRAKGRTRVAAKPVRKPKLFLSEGSLAVPVGEMRRVAIGGTAQGPVDVHTDSRDALAVEATESAVEILGRAPGKATVTVIREGKTAAFTAWVKKYAGRVTATPAAEVTGEVTPASLVRDVAARRVLEGIDCEPGAKAEVTGPPAGLKPVGERESIELAFPISITGDAYLPVKTTAKVRVTNVVLPEAEPRYLLYSNDPESVRRHGRLFLGPVDPAGPVRLLYHHQNRVGTPFVFQVHLLNPGDEAVDVQIVGADAGPFIDPIQVGHRAASEYMAAAAREIGYLARVPPMSAVTVYRRSVPNLQTVSGLFNFRITGGGPLVAHISAAAAANAPAVTPDLLRAAQSQPNIYPSPQKNEVYRYTVGERWAFVPVGRKAIAGRSKERQLFGNYGVLYNITVEVANPTDEIRTVRVVLSPEAGWARGIFMIEGQLVEAPQVAPPAEAVLWTLKIGPQQQRTLKIQGMPVGGSSYPVSIVVRS